MNTRCQVSISHAINPQPEGNQPKPKGCLVGSSNFLRDIQWLKNTFQVGQRVENALITAPDVLTSTVFQKTDEILTQINTLSVPKRTCGSQPFTFQNVCMKVPLINGEILQYLDLVDNRNSNSVLGSSFDFKGKLKCLLVEKVPRECLSTSVLSLWQNDLNATATLTKEDILEVINDETWLTTFGLDPATMLGGIERNSSGKITKATGLLISWFTSVNYSAADLNQNGDTASTDGGISEDTLRWEGAFLDRMQNLSDAFENATFRIDYASARSFNDMTSKASLQGFDMVHVGCVLMFVYMQLVLSKFSWIEIRVLLSTAGLLGVGMALVIAFGIYSASGRTFISSHSAVPYVVIGLGIDDMFVMITGLRKVQKGFPTATPPQQIALMLQNTGVAISVTSLTNIAAFGTGIISPFPAMRMFCLLGAISVLMTYGLVISYFVATLTLDERRLSARRNGIFPWIVHGDPGSKLCCNPRLMDRFLEIVYRKFVMTSPGKSVVIGATLLLTLWNATNCPRLRAKYDPSWHLSKDNYFLEYRSQFERAFPDSGTETFIFFGELNYSVDVRSLILLSRQLSMRRDIIQQVTFWPTAFHQFVQKFHDIDLTTTQLEENEFNQLLSTFLYSVDGFRFQNSFKFTDSLRCGEIVPTIKATYLKFEFKPFKEPEEYIPAKVTIERIVQRLPLTNVDAFRSVWSKDFIFWEAEAIVASETYKNIALTLLVVMLCTAVVLLNLRACFWILVCVLITLINVGGFLHLWGVTLNLTTTLAVQLAIGFSVDYASHVVQTFIVAPGLDRQQRALDTVLHIGPPIFYGGFTTFLSVSMLSFTGLYSYILFARVFFLFVVFGLFTGLILLPVVLSLVGPVAKSSTVAFAATATATTSGSDKPGPAVMQVTESYVTRQGYSSGAYQPE
ncbi:protein patched homolog 1-like [Malaya genurostris]|uniref:protein patched homolog 1-like n=1 Tax=Malaya genurostris TaxID=325434 RepID=UPI0026F38C2F|nr:protein patched homolog 1-like [Malaya genurostris]